MQQCIKGHTTPFKHWRCPNTLHGKIYCPFLLYIQCCHSTILFFSTFQAQCLARPVFIPVLLFALADASWMINVTVRNIFIFSNPRMVCFSNWKSLSILPFTLSMLVLFLYSLFHFLESLATFVNIRGSVFNGMRKILLSWYFGWNP